MGERRDGDGLKKLIRFLAVVLTGAAIAKELRTPPDERTWHGELGGVVPYDFRMPTIEKARARWWNPEGPMIGPQVFGVGWSVNFGRLWAQIKELMQQRAATD